jgi:hypothetical protein
MGRLHLVILDIHLQVLGEAVHGQRRQLLGVRVDVGQIVAGLVVVTLGSSTSDHRRAEPGAAAWR